MRRLRYGYWFKNTTLKCYYEQQKTIRRLDGQPARNSGGQR